jgi:CelD/BcsL family acetyltransferase involved in cellulose biosynthesis
MRVESISSEAELQLFVPEWASLWRRVPDATPFQSPAWLLAWWRHFGTTAPRLLVARDGDALVGVLPVYQLDEPGCCKLLPIGVGLSDYADALIDPERRESAAALLGAIADVPGWQQCHLADLPPGSPLASLPCPPGLREDRAVTAPCPVLPLPSNPGALDSVVPRKTLRDLRQTASRSAAAGGAAIETAEGDRLAGFMDDLFLLHERRWRSRGESGVCTDPDVRAFHCDAARALSEAGMLRLYRLRIGGAVAAVYYGFRWRERSYAYLGGFDPELSRFSPGAQILFHAISEAIAEGCTEFHFLRGGESYKYAWGAVDRWNSALTLTRR